jgi:hypothetical protein
MRTSFTALKDEALDTQSMEKLEEDMRREEP